ncbi:hypothetical protein D3C81_1428670 [compost metagenome]
MAWPFPERPLAVVVIRQNFAFEDDLGMCRHEQIGGIRLHELQRFTHQRASRFIFAPDALNPGYGAHNKAGMMSKSNRNGSRFTLLFVLLIDQSAMVCAKEPNAHITLIEDLVTINSGINQPGFGVADDHHTGR